MPNSHPGNARALFLAFPVAEGFLLVRFFEQKLPVFKESHGELLLRRDPFVGMQ